MHSLPKLITLNLLPYSLHTLSGMYIYRVRQKYMMIWQNSSEWNRWRGEFVLERPSSQTQSISVSMERWSVEHRVFAVVTYFKTNDSVLTQRIFRRQFNIHRNDSVPSSNTSSPEDISRARGTKRYQGHRWI
jgi:hypothetical protein